MIKYNLIDIIRLLNHNRASGTTTAIQNMAGYNDDAIILAATQESAKEIGPHAISITRIPTQLPEDKKIILVDNYTMLKVCQNSLSEIQRLENTCKSYQRCVISMNSAIKKLLKELPEEDKQRISEGILFEKSWERS